MTKFRMNLNITETQANYLRARAANEGRTMPNMLLRMIDLGLAARAPNEKGARSDWQ
jgi:hypothetical protein